MYLDNIFKTKSNKKHGIVNDTVQLIYINGSLVV